MPEREFDGQLAVASTQSALLQAVQEKLAALARSLNFQPYGAAPHGALPQGTLRLNFQSAPGSLSQAAQPSPSVTRARR